MHNTLSTEDVRAGSAGTGLAHAWRSRAVAGFASPATKTRHVLETSRNRYTSPAVPQVPYAEPAAGGRDERNREGWSRRARAFGIEAAPSSDDWYVALILLAASDIGQNIDRVARRTGAPRPLVSKVARRLVENGVWADGETVARWTGDPTARNAFANDVAVGAGRLLRRIGETGRMEWAAAGQWHKNFERDTEERGTSALYVDATTRNGGTPALAEDIEPVHVNGGGRIPAAVRPEPEPEPPVATTRAPLTPEPQPPLLEEPKAAADEAQPEPLVEETEDGEAAPSLDQVFSDAVWLR